MGQSGFKKPIFNRVICWFACGGLILLYSARADERLPVAPATNPVRVVRVSAAPNLKWVHFSQGPNQTLLLSGQLTDPEASLVIAEQKFPVEPGGRFTLKVPRPTKTTEVTVKVVDAYGKVEEEHINIIIRAAAASSSDSSKGQGGESSGKESSEKFAVEDISSNKRFFGTVSVGISQISYTGPGVTTALKEIAATPKFSGTYVLIPDRWDLTANLYFTAPILKSSESGTTLNFLGSNVRGGYHLTPPKAPWKLIFGFGIYYTTTFSNQTIGYANVSGPQVYPILQRRFSADKVFSVYFKYSPVSDSFQLLNLSNHELASGISYRYKKVVSGFDFSHLKLKTAVGTAASTSYSLSVGYLF